MLRPDQGLALHQTEAQPGNVCAADLFDWLGARTIKQGAGLDERHHVQQ